MMKINYLHIAFLSLMSLQNLTAQTYCVSKGNLPWNEWIAQVQFANVHNVSAKEGYGNFVSQTAAVHRGSTYPMVLTRGLSWAGDPTNTTQQGRVWIDFNQNGTFEPTELAASFGRTVSTFNIPIPTTALLGNTRMRISLKTIEIPTPCEIFDRGEVEDYTVNISSNTTNPSCRQDDSLQLVRLYQTTNGANWRQKWLLNTPIHTWAGVTLTPEGCVKGINLSRNQLVGTIPNLNLPKLQTLLLVDNALIGAIPNLNLPDLKTLNVALNQLTGVIPAFNLPQLTDLYLSFNQFSGIIPTFQSPLLKKLHLEGNLLTGAVPNFTYPLLEELQLRTNRLTGTIPNFNLPQLRSLHLELNLLTGTIPNFNLPQLRELLLDDNQLTGAIPNFNLPLLESLGLETNQLSGTLPNFNMPKLKWVLLARNRLTGSLPPFNFPNLIALQLNNNLLTGCIPIEFRTFCNKIIDLSANPGLRNQNFATFCSGNLGLCNPLLPDLTMANLNLTNSIVSQGQLFNYKFDLKNIDLGNAPGNFNVKGYISANNTLDASDIQSGVVPTGNFAGGFSVLQVPASSVIPATLAPGQYYLILKADADNQIVENNENNNILVSVPFQVTVPNSNPCKRYVTENTNERCGAAPTWKRYGLKLYDFTTTQSTFYQVDNANLDVVGNKAVLTGTFRTASWQPIQVKVYFTQFPSNSYRGSACGTGIQDTTGWRFPVADSGKIVFPDKTLAISSFSYREGQMGMGANTQDLNVFGFYSLAACGNVSDPANTYNASFVFKLTNESTCNSSSIHSKSITYDGVDRLKTVDFNIFPNPANQEAFLDLKDFENLPVEILVSDIAGKIILKQSVEKASVSPHRLNTSTLKNGTYFIEIQSVGKRITRQLYILN